MVKEASKAGDVMSWLFMVIYTRYMQVQIVYKASLIYFYNVYLIQ